MDNSKYTENTNPQVSWKDLTKACEIYEPATSEVTHTGGWRVMKPVFDASKCKQCLLCVPVCPDMSIPVNKDGKREDFNYTYCKGCGICSKACPFGAITMVKNS